MAVATLPTSPVGLLSNGRAALARADWKAAQSAFRKALRKSESAEAHEGLGMACWCLGDGPALFRARERAFQLYRKRGDRTGAARVAFQIGNDTFYLRGQVDIARGWTRRARRLLRGLSPCPELGWLQLVEADFALQVDYDPGTARVLARQGASIARKAGAEDLETAGLATEGLALVMQGRVAPGMRLLDEAATAASSGEIDNPVVGMIAYCNLLNACDQVRDVIRASQWIPRAKEFSERFNVSPLFSLCRIIHAGLLVWKGGWREADAVLTEAVRQLRNGGAALLTEASSRLAELRRRQGRTRHASTLLAKLDGHAPSLVVRSNLALSRGHVVTAVQTAERGLRNHPKESRPQRFQAVEALVHARLAAGDRTRAVALLPELRSIASTLGTDAFRGACRFAEGRVLESGGRYEGARVALEDAVDAFSRCGAPYELARARFELGLSLSTLGQKGEALEEIRRACDGWRRLGARHDSAKAESAARTIERSPDGRASKRDRPAGLTRRETEVIRLLAQGYKNSQIGARLHVSEFTVKRHVANILTRLDLPSRAAAAAFAVRRGLA